MLGEISPSDDFPRLYHAHHARHMEDLPFWLELAGESGGSVLELGCGSGRVLLPLADAGYSVTGMDIDGGMLDLLRENLPDGLQPRVNLVQTDFTRFELGEKFRLVILPCNTYSTLDAQQRQALLACVTRHLERDGLFVTGLPNPALLRQLPAFGEPEIEETFPHPVDGRPVNVLSSWRRTARGVTIAWDYEYPLLSGRVVTMHREVHHHPVSIQTHLTELHRAGFTGVTIYGEFDRSPYHAQAQNLILCARFQPAGPA
jgi:SAM-dependent methyltransferase